MSDKAADMVMVAANKIIDRAKPIFAGQSPAVQGAALYQLLAIWLNGHRVIGSPEAEAELRRDVLTMHVRAVCGLVPLLDADDILNSLDDPER